MVMLNNNAPSPRDFAFMAIKQSQVKDLLRRQSMSPEDIARERIINSLCARVSGVIDGCFTTSASRKTFFTSGHIFVMLADEHENSYTLGVPVAAGMIISRSRMMRHGAWQPLIQGRKAIITMHIRRQLLKSLNSVSAKALRAAMYEIKIIPDVQASHPSIYTHSGDVNDVL